MPIAVICPGCGAQFRVSDKFGGKQGPCPKCKALINVPKPEEVKIHVEEEVVIGAAKGAANDGTPRPIRRKKFELGALWATILIGAAIAVVFIAWIAGDFFLSNVYLRGPGLLAVSIPLCVGVYELLREDELEPYRGTNLWLRAAICGLVYAGLWGSFALLPGSMFLSNYIWIVLPFPFLLIGALAGFASFDLSYENGFFHYTFYLLITLVLRALIGLPALWNLAPPEVTPGR